MALPPRGSAQDELLFILHERALEARFTEVAVITALLGRGDDPRRKKLLQVFREELFEDAYRPAILRARKAEARKAAKAAVDRARMMEKVAKLEVGPADEVIRPKSKKSAAAVPKRRKE